MINQYHAIIIVNFLSFLMCITSCHAQCAVSAKPTICPPGDITCLTPEMLACQQSKYNLPFGAQLGSKAAYTSFVKSLNNVSHPKGSILFTQNASLGNLFDTFLTSLQQDPSFLPYFTKLHIIILHELYLYLTKIYINFNLSHVDTIAQHLDNEVTLAQNKKTLIINYLINIIESQANQAFIGLFPSFPQNVASMAGNLLLENDYGADLNLLMEEFEETLLACPASANVITPIIKGTSTTPGLRNQYLTYLSQYLKFFNSYLAIVATDVKTFIQYAQHIQQIINATNPPAPKIGYSSTINDQFKQSMAALRSGQFINPPLFFYSQETMRGIKLVWQLATSLPKNTTSIGWPQQLIDNAQSGKILQNKWGINVNTCICGIGSVPVRPSFFTDANNEVTQSLASAKHLFVNIPTMQGLYTQEVLAQPAWMNSQQGIINMLRACLGDFAALFSTDLYQESILDPCLYCIFHNAAVKAGLSVNADPTSCITCNNFIQQLKLYAPTITCPSSQPDSTTIPSVPTLPNGNIPPPLPDLNPGGLQ